MPREKLRGSAIAAYYEASPSFQKYMNRLVREMEILAIANLEVVRSNAAIDAQAHGDSNPDPLGGASIRVEQPAPNVWRVVLHDVGRLNRDGTHGSAAANIIELGRPGRLYLRHPKGGGVLTGSHNNIVAELAYGYAQRGKFILRDALKAIRARRRRR